VCGRGTRYDGWGLQLRAVLPAAAVGMCAVRFGSVVVHVECARVFSVCVSVWHYPPKWDFIVTKSLALPDPLSPGDG
jgi:hypothetical protein